MTLRQSFAWWSFSEGLRDRVSLLESAADIGFTGVDFLDKDLWPVARDVGLGLVVTDGHTGADTAVHGFNDRGNHRVLGNEVKHAIDRATREGIGHLAVAFGNNHGLSDQEATAVCAEGLAPLAEEAEQAGVGLLLEPLNSTVDHAGHQCDRSWMAFSVVDQVGSPALRVLYDGYHMQLMEGNLMTTIDDNLGRIGHVHVAGVPGRRDPDHWQEVNWPAVARLLHDRSYSGFIGHEFFPKGEAESSLKRSFSVFSADLS